MALSSCLLGTAVRRTIRRLNVWKLLFFLRDVVFPRMLCCLRFIEIILPPADPDHVPTDSPAHNDWVRTMSYVKGNMLYLHTLCVYFFNFIFPNVSLHIERAILQGRRIRPLPRCTSAFWGQWQGASGPYADASFMLLGLGPGLL